MDLVWNSWIKGFPRREIGEYTINFGKGLGFKTQSISGKFYPVDSLEITLFVYRYVISKKINTNLFVLKDAKDIPFKVQLIKIGEEINESLPIYRFEDENQLKQYENIQSGIKLKWDIRLNRITIGTMYWPPSKEYTEKVEQAINSTKSGNFIVSESKNIIESLNDQLNPEWIKFYNDHFKHRDPHYFEQKPQHDKESKEGN